MIRNPIAPTNPGIVYTNNVYAVKDRNVHNNGDGTSNVVVQLALYTDETREILVSDSRAALQLVGLAEEPVYADYMPAILAQYPDKVVDGSKLSDFIPVV